MSFLYPRVIVVTRPSAPVGAGYTGGYAGALKSTETAVVSGIAANIQAKTTMGRTLAGTLPSAAPGPIVWRVFIALGLVADGVIKDRDIITDDLGRRFQIEAAYSNSMGWNIACIRLETH